MYVPRTSNSQSLHVTYLVKTNLPTCQATNQPPLSAIGTLRPQKDSRQLSPPMSLPEGWEELFDAGSQRVCLLRPSPIFWLHFLLLTPLFFLIFGSFYQPYFVNHTHRHTTFVDPRRLSEIPLPKVTTTVSSPHFVSKF
jgi:hypothetical protein